MTVQRRLLRARMTRRASIGGCSESGSATSDEIEEPTLVVCLVRHNPVRPCAPLNSGGNSRHDQPVLELLLLLLRAIALACRGHREVVLENIALRHQLRTVQRRVKRPRICPSDRMFWVLFASAWRGWRSALVLVQPDTVLRWHRDWLRRRWGRRSGRNRAGRRALDQELRTQIAAMASANPLWGAPRIHGELRTLGFEVSERIVSRLLARLSRPPSQTWRTFLANHVSALASMDFFTVSTMTGRLLFVFVVLSHDRRRVLHINCTPHPTSAWTAQQLVEAFPEDTAPRWLLRDRDSIYDDTVRRRIASLGITEVVSSPRSPWQSPYVERVIGSMRRECLDHVIVLGEAHLRRILRSYLTYYHRSRTHLALDKDAPDRRPSTGGSGRIIATPEVGGLHHRYDRQAA
jgi:putative transposase